MSFAEKLRKLRTEQGLSQQRLATLAGVSQSAIYYWEKGDRNPKLEQARRIADSLEVGLWDLELDWAAFSDEEWKDDFAKKPDDLRKNRNERFFLKNFWSLNNEGQRKVKEYTKDLTKIPEYCREQEPDDSDTPE